MIGWIIAGIVALLVTLIVFLPIGYTVVYDGKDLKAWRTLGPIKTQAYPSPKKLKKRKDQPYSGDFEEFIKQVEELANDVGLETDSLSSREGLSDLFFLLKIVLVFLNELRMVLPVRNLELKIAIGGEDPGDTAIAYGATWAAVGNIFSALENLLIIKKRDIDIICDFDSGKSSVYGKAVLYMPLHRWVKLLGSQSGLPVVREYVDIKLRKGGIVK